MSADSDRLELPREPIHRLTESVQRFIHVEAASGIVLALATATALTLANSPLSEAFLSIWKTPVGFEIGDFSSYHSLKHWINDGLMAVFFFVIGLEVKRELVLGELRDLRQAALPIAAAIGGMIVPAGIYLLLQSGGPAQAGWGIPMATDIAFVVGCMAILGSRVPHAFRVLILSLAIADDIGAILVIAIGYTESLSLGALLLGLAGVALLAVFERLGTRSMLVYGLIAFATWFAFHESGVHATIAGVIVGLQTPARSYLDTTRFAQVLNRASDVIQGDWEARPDRVEGLRRFMRATREMVSPLEYLEHTLHPWVGFVIMPIFALANAGVVFEWSDITDPIALSVAAGLLVGKPVGIVLVSFIAVRIGLATLPAGVGWGVLAGGGLLAGIGFTMALFIASLALDGAVLDVAKVGILGASVLAAALGMTMLSALLPKTPREAG